MDREHLESLHQEASRSYLAGDYAAARAAWARLLEVDPADERAREGLRRCDELAGATDMGPIGDLEPDLLEDLSLEIDEAAAAAPSVDPGPSGPGDPTFDRTALDGLETVAPPGQGGDAAGDLESMLVEHEDHTPAAARPSDPATEAAAGSEIPTPDRQGEGIDFGDLDAVSGIGVGTAETPPPVPGSDGTTPGAMPDPAAIDDELQRRVGELLADARAAAEQGRHDDALTVLARVAILDEDNAEAQALEASLREHRDQAAHELEDAIAEGIQWLEGGRIEDAVARFREVVERAPDHQEAAHYLERAEAAMAESTGEAATTARDGDGNVTLEATDEILDVGGEVATTDVLDPGAVDLAPGEEEAPALAEPTPAEPPSRPRPAAGAAAMAPAARSTRRRIPVVPLVLAVAVIGAGGWFAYDRFLAGEPGDAAASSTDAPAARSNGAESGSGEKATEDLIREADRLAAASFGAAPTRADAERITSALARAQRAMDGADWEGAVLAYNEVLKLDAQNAAAAAGLREAGRNYRERRELEEEYDRAVRAFAAGDYTSALRTLYRLPDDLRPDEARELKLQGWYNLGLIELRAGNLDEATVHFQEALAIDATDETTGQALEFAERYRDRTKDRTFYGAVERMEFRGPSS